MDTLSLNQLLPRVTVKNTVSRGVICLIIACSATQARALPAPIELNFALTSQPVPAEMTVTHYEHHSSVGVELISKYQFSDWLSLSVDMNGEAVAISPYKQQTRYQDMSAKAAVGHSFLFHRSELKPFAQIGLGYSKNNTSYQQNTYQPVNLKQTDLQIGLGLRYSHTEWHNFGVSLTYQNSSKLLTSADDSEARSTLADSDNAIGVSIDIGF